RTVERGFGLGASLGGVGRCADVRALQEAVAPPEDPAVLAEVTSVRAELARANAERLAGPGLARGGGGASLRRPRSGAARSGLAAWSRSGPPPGGLAIPPACPGG